MLCNNSTDFFSKPIHQNQIINSYEVPFSPISTLSRDSPIEFRLMGSGDDYFNLAFSYLEVKVSVKNENKENFYGKNAFPVNNLLHSLFSQVDC